jgi:hypothetical protein
MDDVALLHQAEAQEHLVRVCAHGGEVDADVLAEALNDLSQI